MELAKRAPGKLNYPSGGRGGPSERFGDLIKMEIPRCKRVAAAAGIKPE